MLTVQLGLSGDHVQRRGGNLGMARIAGAFGWSLIRGLVDAEADQHGKQHVIV